MGLEAVEIVMATEEQFGISIADHEAENVATPGDLIDLVMTKVQNAGRDVCRTHRAFCLTRRHLIDHSNIPRHAIALNTPIRELIPPAHQKEFWTGLSHAISAKHWPALQLSPSIRFSILAASIIVFVLTAASMWPGEGSFAIAAGLTASLTTLFTSIALLRHRRQFIPNKFKTIRDLSLLVAGEIEEGKWVRSEVAVLIKKIVIEQLGISESRYREDAHFVRDLGIG